MTYNKQQSFAHITALVQSFNSSESRLATEVEAQIENNYIRPLFRFLNWNTENSGLHIEDFEFLLQHTHRYGKRPDYILQLERQHLLVMDAKRVKEEMHDLRWMNQIYAYAYSTQNLRPSRKIDFAVLTDFQEFIVLDCTLHASKPRMVGSFRVLDWKCDDFLSSFDTLWDLFEREHLRAACLTRGSSNPSGLWALKLSPSKLKANRVPPDKAFLAEIDDDHSGWRVRIAKDMKRQTPAAEGASITAAVQLLIDRFIFIKALSDREIEEDYLTQIAEAIEVDGLADTDTGWLRACQGLFDKLNAFYNGTIFRRSPELDALPVSNKVVRSILHEMQPDTSPYNFSSMPVEILGTIYERFLGRVVRTTDQRVKIEDKPEVRKAGGVYYTPQYIVDYLLGRTLGSLLAACTTPEQVAKIKVLDPACGSGSFLLGAFSLLVDWHSKYYAQKGRLSAQDRQSAYRDTHGVVRLTARMKRKILLNSIFGVDIDPQAVEVTCFSLSLKALEDTRRDELYEERTLFKQSVLPDLTSNIKCGNSLVESDFSMLPDDLLLARAFDWQVQFPEILTAGGFHVVVGNPPWGAEIDPQVLRYLSKRYARVVKRMVDSYIYFSDLSLRLVRHEGLVGLVLPSTVLNQVDAAPLRKLFLERGIDCVVNLGRSIFTTKVLNTTTLVVVNSHHQTDKMVVADLSRTPLADRESALAATVPIPSKPWLSQVRSDPANTFFANPHPGTGILLRLAQSHPTLANITQGGIARGASPDIAAAHIVSDGTRGIRAIETAVLRRSISGKAVKRYTEATPDQWIIYTDRTLDPRSIPNALKWLAKWRHLNSCKEVKEGKHPWWSLHRPRHEAVFQSPKLIGLTTTKTIEILLDSVQNLVVTDAMYLFRLLPGIDARAALGILHSRLFLFLYRISNQGESRVIPQIKAAKLEPLPFPDLTLESSKPQVQQLSQLVEKMYALTRTHTTTTAEDLAVANATSATLSAIDKVVYELYGLTPAEIDTVERHYDP